MKYLGKKVTVHQFANDWVTIDAADGSFESKVISPRSLEDVTFNDYRSMSDRPATHTGSFWDIYVYNQDDERFESRRQNDIE